MMGDTSANDAQPAGEQGTDYAVPCHTEMQTRRGIWNLENVDTKSLIDAKVIEGAFIWAPLRIVGGTGSPAKPGGLVLKSSAGSGAREHRCPLHRADNRSVASVACPSKPGKPVRQGVRQNRGSYMNPAPNCSTNRHSKTQELAPEHCCPNPAPGRLLEPPAVSTKLMVRRHRHGRVAPRP